MKNYAPHLWREELRGHARPGGAGRSPEWHKKLPRRAAQSHNGAWAVACGAVLRYYRLKANISQEVLAIRAGMDRTYPSLIERGLRCPTICSLCAMASALGVSAPVMLQRIMAEKRHPQLREPVLKAVLEDR